MVKNTDRRARAAGDRRQHAVAFTQPRRRQVLHFLLPLHPPVARHDDDVVFFDDEGVGGVFDLLGLLDARAPRLAVLLLNLLELVAHQLPARVLVLQQRGDLPRALALLGQLVLDDENLEPRQPIQLELEDRVGLLGVEREALDDLLGRVGLAVRLADDADDLVERVEDLLEALEDVDAALELFELVLEPAGDDVEAELEELPEHLRAARAAPAGPTCSFSVGTRHVMLTANVVCSGVFLNRYAITRFSSAPAFSSSSIRTSSVDRSLTSTRCGILRLRTTSPMRSTSCALLTA